MLFTRVCVNLDDTNGSKLVIVDSKLVYYIWIEPGGHQKYDSVFICFVDSYCSCHLKKRSLLYAGM